MKNLIACIIVFTLISTSYADAVSMDEFKKSCSDFESAQCKQYLYQTLTKILTSDDFLASSAEDFGYGFYLGIQKNPLYPSTCIQSFTALSYSSSQLYSTFVSIFSTLNLNYLFQSITNFNDYSNKLTSSWDLCKGNSLQTTLNSLSTTTGFSTLLINLGSNYSNVVINIDLMNSSLENGEYINAGVAAGQITSSLLNFWL